jgi:hypothetical protein
MNPRVFVSHASEDKDRFVLAFAKKLRARGIDAWVDRWEMLPGDKLVEKIFQEGIHSAAAMIVVLSRFSCTKPWVREEIDAGFVKRVNEGSKLIPVVIEPCDVPEVLKTTLWEQITDLDSYDEALDRIVAAITGVHEKPPLGPPPKVTRLVVDAVPGLAPADSLILRLLGEKAVRSGSRFLHCPEIFDEAKAAGLSETDITEALEILVGRSYLKGYAPSCELTHPAFDQYLRHFVADYSSIHKKVCFAILNDGLDENRPISEALGVPLSIVNHVLDDLHRRNLAKVQSLVGGMKTIFSPSAELRRLMRS